MKLVSLVFFGAIILSLCVQTISAYKWEQRVALNMIASVNSLGGWLPLENNSAGMGEIDLSKYSNVSEIYFETQAEFDYTGIPNGVGSCSVRLYDTTTNLEINESQYALTGISQYLRSKNITYIFNKTSPIVIMSQTIAGADSICYLYHANLVIVQNGKISKTRTMIPIGASLTEGDTCQTPEEATSEPKYWNWSANDFVSTNITFAGTLTSTDASSLGRIFLSNSTTNLASLTSVGLSIDFRYYNSTNLNTNFSNSSLTATTCKVFGVGSGFMRNAFIVVDQDGINTEAPKTVAMFQTDVDLWLKDSDIPADNDNQSEFFNSSNWDGINLNPYSEYVIKQTNGDTIYARMKKGTKVIPETNVSVANSTFKFNRSGMWNELYFLRNDYLQTEIWDNSTTGNAQISSGRIIFFINGFRCWYYDAVNDKFVLNTGCRLPFPAGSITFY